MSKNNQKIIDVIIPAFKAQDTIDRTLSSIATQTIVDQIQVTIINDCDGIGYSKHIKRFKGLIDIEEIELKKNGGPGVARQIGIVKTKCPYITFIDADDTFHNPFAVDMMLKHLLADDKVVASVGEFIEQRKDQSLNLLNHSKDMIWMFGKMYKRDFLERYKIQFNSTRSNEDTGFNTIVSLCSNTNESVNFFQIPVYIWWYKEDSITRINDCEYTYNQSFVGLVKNMIYAINHVRSVQPFNSKADIKAIESMASIYVYWLKTKFRDTRFIEQNFQWAKKYYFEIFVDVMERIPQNEIINIVARQISDETPSFKDIVPDITFYQFLELLDKEQESEVEESGTENKETNETTN